MRHLMHFPPCLCFDLLCILSSLSFLQWSNRASAADESDEDYDSDSMEEVSISEEEEPSLYDEDEAASVLDSGFMEFGSFHSNLVRIKPMKAIKSEIKGSTIKIGEITCFLVSGAPINDVVLLDPEVKVDEKSQKVKELNVDDLFKKVDWMNLVSYDSLAFDLHHADFTTVISDCIISDSFLNLIPMVIAPVNHCFDTVTFPPPPSPWFFTGKSTVFTVHSYVCSSNLSGVCITTFDPGGTLNTISNSATPPQHTVLVFDPGGNNHCSTLFSSPCSGFIFDPGINSPSSPASSPRWLRQQAPLFSNSRTNDFIFFAQDSFPLCFKKILFDLHLVLDSILRGTKNTTVDGDTGGDDGSGEILRHGPQPHDPGGGKSSRRFQKLGTAEWGGTFWNVARPYTAFGLGHS